MTHPHSRQADPISTHPRSGDQEHATQGDHALEATGNQDPADATHPSYSEVARQSGASIPLVVGMGQGTIIRLKHIEDYENSRGPKGPDLGIEFEFVERGRLTRFQLRKRLQRIVVSMLVKAVGQTTPSSRWDRTMERNRRWLDKNIDFHRE